MVELKSSYIFEKKRSYSGTKIIYCALDANGQGHVEANHDTSQTYEGQTKSGHVEVGTVKNTCDGQISLGSPLTLPLLLGVNEVKAVGVGLMGVRYKQVGKVDEGKRSADGNWKCQMR